MKETVGPQEGAALLDWIGQALKPPWWHLSAGCRDANPDLFFIERGHSAVAAKAICAECPVAGACLEWAMSQSELPQGIWGGMTLRERRGEKQRRKGAASVA